MAEYSSMKVPELKKLLGEKGLTQTGNKADLIARLKEADEQGQAPAQEAAASGDAKEDEITFSDDDAAAAPAPAASKDAVPATAPAQPAETQAAKDNSKPVEDAPAVAAAPPAQSFAMGLSDTTVDDEAKKRADRAKRFGLEEDEETKKRTDRAKRFGIDDKELASGLDSALPERPLKRGRDRGDGDGGNRPGKRQSLDRRGGRRRGRGGPAPNGDRKDAPRGILDDPAEKAKAEKRAARFAAA